MSWCSLSAAEDLWKSAAILKADIPVVVRAYIKETRATRCVSTGKSARHNFGPSVEGACCGVEAPHDETMKILWLSPLPHRRQQPKRDRKQLGSQSEWGTPNQSHWILDVDLLGLSVESHGGWTRHVAAQGRHVVVVCINSSITLHCGLEKPHHRHNITKMITQAENCCALSSHKYDNTVCHYGYTRSIQRGGVAVLLQR